MAIIPQKSLFSWKEIEALGDLERLRLVLAYLPDEPLMQVLEAERGKGRDDYPVRAVWNSLLAGVVYQHVSVESLRRELLRNGQLRDQCGFDPVRGGAAVPPPWAYTRFLEGLFRHAELIDAMFDELVESLRRELPGFGRHLAGDGKAIPTHARAPKKDAPRKTRDGRRDLDADWGQKTTRKKRKDGTLYEPDRRANPARPRPPRVHADGPDKLHLAARLQEAHIRRARQQPIRRLVRIRAPLHTRPCEDARAVRPRPRRDARDRVGTRERETEGPGPEPRASRLTFRAGRKNGSQQSGCKRDLAFAEPFRAHIGPVGPFVCPEDGKAEDENDDENENEFLEHPRRPQRKWFSTNVCLTSPAHGVR